MSARRRRKGKGAFDINEPGKVQPQPTSRPVIVGHHPTMPDPMLAKRPLHHEPRPSGPQIPTSPPEPQAPPPPPPLIDGILRPPEAPKSGVDDEPTGPPAIIEGEPLQSPPFATPAHDTEPPSSHFPSGPTLTSVTPAPIEHAPRATVVGEANKPLEMPSAKPDAHLWRWLIVFAILVLVGLYLLVDAEIINIGFDLPFEIFK
ncbi:hypothetical protein A3F05_01115 [Candidatus Saccharibacteria bacterium RIFCSPHIGHO2_12_FULL_47_17]|nr:MAG: hypothetical protein A3F05_01115 [Candidatus Saccharibacteria bacterium RIFCSPHIGHO2_12_FULL_47_17]